MAREFAKDFYNSAVWRKTRDAYCRHVFGICERCGRPGDIVHHKVYLTPQNIADDAVALSFDNLELLCIACHNREHETTSAISAGLSFDSNGDIVETPQKGKKQGGIPPI